MKKLMVLLLYVCFLFGSCESRMEKAAGESHEITPQNEKINKGDTMSFCHFAKIVDKDGYVNVRQEQSAKSRITGRIKSGEVVFIVEDLNTDWLSVRFYDHESKKDSTGYVHRTRIKYINSLEEIPAADYDDEFVRFSLRTIAVNIQTGTFDYEANKKYFSKDEKGFDEYKGRFMLGTEGYISEAKTVYKSISATIGNQTLEIPERETEDLFNANNQYTECYFDKNDHTLYIHLSNSDGAGAYVVLFTIQNGMYKWRQVELPV